MKRFLCWILVFTMACVPCSVLAQPPATYYTPGDVNADGKISLVDMVMIMRYVVDKKAPSPAFIPDAADTDGDGTVTARDAVCAARQTVGGHTVTLVPSSAHVHAFYPDWSQNADGHWRASRCGCNVLGDYAAHDMVGGSCRVCGYVPHAPKTIELIFNEETGTLSLPADTVVYVGDTLVIPRDEMVYIRDCYNPETESMAYDVMLYPDEYIRLLFQDYDEPRTIAYVHERVAVDDNIIADENGWKNDANETMAIPGWYNLHLDGAMTADGQMKDALDLRLLTFYVHEYPEYLTAPSSIDYNNGQASWNKNGMLDTAVDYLTDGDGSTLWLSQGSWVSEGSNTDVLTFTFDEAVILTQMDIIFASLANGRQNIINGNTYISRASAYTVSVSATDTGSFADVTDYVLGAYETNRDFVALPSTPIKRLRLSIHTYDDHCAIREVIFRTNLS